MTQAELISVFPAENSIPSRVLLITPELFDHLLGQSIQECRVFFLVTDGSITIKMGCDRMDLNKNVLVDLYVRDRIQILKFSDDVRAWCLLPNYIFTNESLNGLKPSDSESFKERRKIPMLPLEPPETERLERHLAMLAQALGDFSNYYRIELCQTYFRSFMLEAGNLDQHKKKALKEAERIESRQDAMLRSFLKLVWQHYRSEHNVDFYALRLCITAKHLSRVVKDRLGKTPYAVIRDELLQHGCEELKTSAKSVQEISSELNFSETASFCKFFKKHTGLSPTAYRAEYLSDIKEH